MDQMKQALTRYYEKLKTYCLEEYGEAPTVPYSGEQDDALLYSPENEDGECEWRPVSVKQSIDWCTVEAKLGFSVREELRSYFDEFLFCSLCGEFNGYQLYFTPHISEKALIALLMQQHSEAIDIFERDGYFYLGFAIRDGDDDYGIYYDNNVGMVLCAEHETGEMVSLSPSLAELISEMEAFD